MRVLFGCHSTHTVETDRQFEGAIELTIMATVHFALTICGLISVWALSTKGVASFCPQNGYGSCFPCPLEYLQNSSKVDKCHSCPPGIQAVAFGSVCEVYGGFTAHVELNYLLSNNCTDVHQDNVTSIIRSSLINLNSDWPGLCRNSTCSNARIMSKCKMLPPYAIETKIDIYDVLPYLASTRTDVVLMTEAVLNDTSATYCVNQTLLDAQLDRITINISFTCRDDVDPNKLWCSINDAPVAMAMEAGIGLVQLILTLFGVCIGLAILAILIVILVRKHRKCRNVNLNSIPFENPPGSICSATEQGADSKSTFSVRTWTPKIGGLTPKIWTTSSGDVRSNASDIYDVPEPVGTRTDYLTPTVPAIFTMGPALPPRRQTVKLLRQKSRDVAHRLTEMTSQNVPIKMTSRNSPATTPPGNVSMSMKPGSVLNSVTSRNVSTKMTSPNVTAHTVPTVVASRDSAISPSFDSLNFSTSLDNPVTSIAKKAIVKENNLQSFAQPTQISFRGHRKPDRHNISQETQYIHPTFV